MSIFLDRYSKVFGRPSAMMLKIAGLTASERYGRGAIVSDSEGKNWLDFGSFGVHLLGHSHPNIVNAVNRQLLEMGLSTKILANEPILLAAERSSRLKGQTGVGVSFANSGSEAIEVAIKMARLATGRDRFLALVGGYHGRTDGALQLSSSYKGHIGAPRENRALFVKPGDLDDLEAHLKSASFAALFIEPIQGEGGIQPIPRQFVEQAALLCERYGSLLISDEIQTGLGRSGSIISCPFADIVVLGKALAGGVMPISALLFSEDKISSRARDPIVSASSYAGSPLGGVVINAVLDEVLQAKFLDDIDELSATAFSELSMTLNNCKSVTDIRGRGLMIGIELTSSNLTGDLILKAAANGLLVSFCLSKPNVVRLYPPAVSTNDQLITGIRALGRAFEAMHSIEEIRT